MWDVKRRNEIYFRGLDDGFTLTMWDVKYYGYNSATWTDDVLP